MADFGRLLISKIVEVGDITTATLAGIRSDWFDDPEHSATFAWLLEYTAKYGDTATPRALKAQFPNFRIAQCDEPYDYYVDWFRDQRQRSILVDGIVGANTALETDDPVKAQNAMALALLQLGNEVGALTDVDVMEDADDRLDRYKARRLTAGKVTGVATGFNTLDFVTGGFHPEQFIILGGSAKMGKSFLLMKSAIAAQESRKRALVISFEMSLDEQMARYDGIIAGVNAMKVLHGTTSEEDIKKVEDAYRQRRNLEPLVISADTTATTTVSGISAKIEQHQPDIVFVDGMYLMENEAGFEDGTTQALTSISRGLKRLAQRKKIPIFGTTQSLSSKMGKNGEVTMHSLGWTSAWSQDADLILGAERVPDAPLLNLRIVAGRNVSPQEINLHCNWEESMIEEVDMEGCDTDDE